ncbi:hypothetical protein DENSPDRAFT_887392 [Dentipellis sp. KUC8613]|nr:hypothetical protein DENSPDRAFT_887392 [Dentipellis sp. KUC8613]
MASSLNIIDLSSSNSNPEFVEAIQRKRFPAQLYELDEDGHLIAKSKPSQLSKQSRSFDAFHSPDTRRAHFSEPGVSSAGRGDSEPPQDNQQVVEAIISALKQASSSPIIPSVSRALACLWDNPSMAESVLWSQFDILSVDKVKRADVAQVVRTILSGINAATAPSASGSPPPEPLALAIGDAATSGMTPFRQARAYASGNGQTIWFTTSSNSSLAVPPRIDCKIGDLYLHRNTANGVWQTWVFTEGGWVITNQGAVHPADPARVLSFRQNQEPSWVLRATEQTNQSRKLRKLRGRSVTFLG